MGEVVVVTGGSRGIGAATAVLAASRGYDVCVGYRHRRDAAESVVARCRSHGVQAIAVPVDVSDQVQVEQFFSTVDAELGPVRGLVNNAGILDLQTRVEQMEAERIARILQVNVVGAFICAREAVRRMSTQRGGAGGAIVNISSRAAVLGGPGEYVDYAASKAAVDALTVGLAQEVATEGIRVNGVRPGVIDTEIHASGGEPGRVARVAERIPMRRGGTVDEVAAAVLWLLSSEASYVTGAILDVSGGR
jgi:NAD(P)-dependent dehydrogenase (short-subunit alcohol dehydrogenase family)